MSRMPFRQARRQHAQQAGGPLCRPSSSLAGGLAGHCTASCCAGLMTPLLDASGCCAGCQAIAELATKVRPRYHVAGGEAVFYARPPYLNRDLGAGERNPLPDLLAHKHRLASKQAWLDSDHVDGLPM